MLRKIIKLRSLAFLPRILRTFDSRFLGGKIQKATKTMVRRKQKTSSALDEKVKREKCKMVLEFFFGPPEYFIENSVQPKSFSLKKELLKKYPFTLMIPRQTHLNYKKQCEKCEKIINEFFGEAELVIKNNNMVEPISKYPLEEFRLQATTTSEDEEKLVQKLENVNEPSIVPAESKKVEGFNSPPKILGHKKSHNTKGKFSPETDLQLCFDDIAKKCIGAPQNQIDMKILQELSKHGIPLKSNSNKEWIVSNQPDFVQCNINNNNVLENKQDFYITPDHVLDHKDVSNEELKRVADIIAQSKRVTLKSNSGTGTAQFFNNKLRLENDLKQFSNKTANQKHLSEKPDLEIDFRIKPDQKNIRQDPYLKTLISSLNFYEESTRLPKSYIKYLDRCTSQPKNSIRDIIMKHSLGKQNKSKQVEEQTIKKDEEHLKDTDVCLSSYETCNEGSPTLLKTEIHSRFDIRGNEAIEEHFRDNDMCFNCYETCNEKSYSQLKAEIRNRIDIYGFMNPEMEDNLIKNKLEDSSLKVSESNIVKSKKLLHVPVLNSSKPIGPLKVTGSFVNFNEYEERIADDKTNKNIKQHAKINQLLDKGPLAILSREHHNLNPLPIEPLPNPSTTIKEESVPLSVLIKQLRHRNKMEIWKRVNAEISLPNAENFIEVEGKCGDRKKQCPPPQRKCLCPPKPCPPKPCPPKPCPPPPPKCPDPCPPKPCPPPPPPKCPDPCPPKPCPPPPPPKCPDPCPPKPCPPPPPPKCPDPCAPRCKFSIFGIFSYLFHPNLYPTVALINFNCAKSFDTLRGIANMMRKESLNKSFSTYRLVGPRTYEPWTPIPSRPFPNKEEKKKLQTPRDGCPALPPGKCKDFCPRQKPCVNFPRRNFSMVDLFYRKRMYEFYLSEP